MNILHDRMMSPESHSTKRPTLNTAQFLTYLLYYFKLKLKNFLLEKLYYNWKELLILV